MSWQAKTAAEKIGIMYKLSMSQRIILDRLAGRANKMGQGIYPSVKTIMHDTGASESTVHRALRHFLKLGILEYGDPQLVAHLPADNRPRVYNIVLSAAKRAGIMMAKIAKRLPGRKKPVDKPKSEPVRGVTVTPEKPVSGCHDERQTVNFLKKTEEQPPADAGRRLLASIRARRAQRAQGLPMEPLPLVFPALPAALPAVSSPVGGPSSTAWE